ncbi:MAG: Carbohydrate kinase, FGGY family [uncultured Thiotrichaceae bacterium]|uniref:Carbohydrate kinase, FGGY family n=1 Tax=uncultured Thiotrichaceae bacterium TaxID=298394 RepID=A0A6S6TWF3_9GAMM|nr:MAG: Carbohydrate kinase, FGGY family [uncultured Thiotrichaceae bacterium]
MNINNPSQLYAGIDIGTSGVRCTVIDAKKNILQESRVEYISLDNPTTKDWWESVKTCLFELSPSIRSQIGYLSIDGTSGTVVLTDKQGEPLSMPLMYNDARAVKQAKTIAEYAPKTSTANSVNTSLARILWLLSEYGLSSQECYFVHQTDFIIGKLTGLYNRSDENNALKLGYDCSNNCWPAWLAQLGLDVTSLPVVNKPGDYVAPVLNDVANDLGLYQGLIILAGTTDSIAAFNATGVAQTGIGVTSLGSTLVIKMMADKPIVDTQRGVYSHQFNNQWLVGGASNCGAKILREYFTDSELVTLSKQMRTSQRLAYGYYPLSGKGERFPILDPDKPPILQPRPPEDYLFLQGLLEALAELEQSAYQTLYELGAPKLQKIMTVGGGAKNPQWSDIRKNIIGVPVERVKNSEASFGMALLSLRHYKNHHA